MKKVMMMASAVLMSAVCLAQVANVRKAQNLALQEIPNLEEARRLINEAKVNDETKDQANTWYVAGLIGYQESEAEMNKRYFGQPVDTAVVGNAQMESIQDWIKADELAQVLVQDKKGNMVMDKKNVNIRKNIAQNLLTYWNDQGLLTYAVVFYNQQDYAGAYELYKAYANIPKLPVMQDKKVQEKMVLDTAYQDIWFSTGVLAYYANKYDEGAEIFEQLVRGDFKAVSAGEYLYSCYLNKNDSAKAYEVMDLCIELFPKETRFLHTRANAYAVEKEYDKAVELLDRAIAIDNQAVFYNRKGLILTIDGKYDEAVKVFEDGIKIDPNNDELYTNYGYVYIEQGNKLNDESAYLSDAEYAKARKQIDAIYKKALPLLEKAYSLNKDNYDCERALKSLYYRLGMMEEYNSL